jgi:hypothetical protein
MADQAKVYVPKSSAKEVTFRDGGSMLKLSFKVDEFIAFLQQNKNEKGYINLVCSKRREVGQYGDTHSLVLDTWKPSGDRKPTQATKTPSSPQSTPSEAAPVEEDESTPF